jgi:anti-anti-sigma regulatory factor
MLNVGIENIGHMVVCSCTGNIVQSEDASKLRAAVTSQTNARIIVLDLTEVHAIEGDGLDMLCALQRCALDRNIQFKLFDPSSSVRSRLEHNESTQFDIARFEEMITLLAQSESRIPQAA